MYISPVHFVGLGAGLVVGLGRDGVVNILLSCRLNIFPQPPTFLNLDSKSSMIKFSKLAIYILSRKFLLSK